MKNTTLMQEALMDPNSIQPGADGRSDDDKRPSAVPDWQQGLGPQTPGRRTYQDSAPVTGQSRNYAPAPPAQPIILGQQFTSVGPGGSRRKKLILAACVVVFLLIIAGLSLFAGGGKKTPAAGKQSSGLYVQLYDTKKATALSKFTSVDLTPPAASYLGAFKANSSQTTNAHVYASKAVNPSCSLQLGTYSVDDIGGSDVKGIATQQAAALVSNGMKVAGPKTATTLVLKDASSNATYNIPSVSYSYASTSGTMHGVAYFSAAVLQNTDRVLIVVECSSSSGAVNQKVVNDVLNVAQRITVTKQ